MKPLISRADFDKLDVRVGVILTATKAQGLKKDKYRFTIDFADPELGTKVSLAGFVATYSSPEQLIGKRVLCVVNVPSMPMGKLPENVSEVFTLGVGDPDAAILIMPDPEKDVPVGVSLC